MSKDSSLSLDDAIYSDARYSTITKTKYDSFMKQKNIVLFGAGGHAKVIIEAVIKAKRNVAYIFDSNTAKENSLLLNLMIKAYRTISDIPDNHEFIVTIGNEKFRKHWYQELSQYFLAARLIHPTAAVTDFCDIGLGTVILGQASVNPDARIGCNVIINTGAIVEHDCIIGDHSQVAPNATLCGDVSVGECTLIGAGATILPGINIGNNVIVGAGAVVVKNISDNAIVAGNPAKNIR